MPVPAPLPIVSIKLCYNGRENAKAIKEYIAMQLKQDKESSQMSIDDPDDPFTGNK